MLLHVLVPAYRSRSPAKAPTVHEADLDDALTRNELARAILATESLEEAEQYSREICGYLEIDYERNKASWLGSQPEQKLDPEGTLLQLDQFEADARSRGITHTTFRRITEALGLDGKQRQDLRALLLSSRPEQYEAPLRRIPAGPAAAPPKSAADPHLRYKPGRPW
ncbi:hypothetical protein [Streptomyces sp. NBC_00564]|uniref:hypothetical protein n=1 Tax=Streptomyces sp. NBC_00564 TaxID=2903663 RepID=UPI00352EEDFB